jgi:hypothetical protein
MTVFNTKQTPEKNMKMELDQSTSPAPYQRATTVDTDTMTTDATVKAFKYGVRFLAPDEIALELPSFPLCPSP